MNNESIYKACYDNSMDAILLTIPDGTIIAANPAACQMFGMTETEICQCGAAGILDQNSPNLSSFIAERNKNGKANAELIYIRKNGTKFTGDASSRIFKDENGELRTSMIIRDKTEIIIKEYSLIDTEEKFDQIISLAREGIWVIDENKKTTFVSDQTCRILGYSPQEILNRPIADLMDANSALLIDDKIANRKKGIAEVYNLGLLTKQGKTIVVELNAAPFIIEGRYQGSLVLVTDVMQRKIAEREFYRREERFRVMFENNYDVIILLDEHLQTIYRSPSTLRVMGFTDEERIGRSYLELIHPDDIDSIKRMQLKVLARPGVPIQINVRAKQAAGHYLWFEGVATNLLDNLLINAVVVNLRDVSERKMADDEKRIATVEKEKLLADLIQRNKDLEQFTYTISHNLRAPVANAIGLSNLLKQSDIDDETKEFVVNGLSTSIQNIDNVILDLNHLIQSRKHNKEIKELVYFDKLLTDIQISISDLILKENVTIESDFTQAKSIFSIQSYLYSIIYNLILNSIKYRNPDVTPMIKVSTSVNAETLEICIADNGKGIDLEKNESKLFGLYTRFDTSVEGKGMGLYILKTQVDALNGTIDVESEINSGTLFRIKIPVQAPPQKNKAK